MRVLVAHEMPAGTTRILSAHDLRALCRDQPEADQHQVVSVQPEREGWLPSAALQCRLAPHAPAQTLALESWCAGAGGAGAGAGLRLRVTRPLLPGEELRVWPAPRLLLAAQVPFLLPRHIRGWSSYVCDICGESFTEPNPLKAHLFLRCGAPASARFWRELLARLAAPPAPAPSPAPMLPDTGVRAGGAGAGGHRCGYCGRVYSRRYGLRIHTRTHTGHKPLRCPHCARPFADPSNLNKHVRLHKARAAAAAASPAAEL